MDAAVAELWSDFSRAKLTEWIKSGAVRLNGQPVKPKDKVNGGERVELETILENQNAQHAPQEMALNVVFEDEAILVINKPAGLVVHPGAGNSQGTLLNALLHHAPELEKVPRAGIVHRLDKLTSGLMVVAKTLQAQTNLVEQLQARSVQRQYDAILNGELIAGGVVEEPIGRHPKDRTRQAIVSEAQGGKEAITHYRVVEKFYGFTHVNCFLETGRTHQIRVHMASIRHALVGDPVYGKRFGRLKGMTDAQAQAISQFGRQALHASALALLHPSSGEERVWRVPLPEDMASLLEVLRGLVGPR